MSRALDKEIIGAIGNISVSSTPNASDVTNQAQNGKLFYISGPFPAWTSTTFRPSLWLVNPAGSGKNLIVFRAATAVGAGAGAAIRTHAASTSHFNMTAADVQNALYTGGEVATFSAYRASGNSTYSEGTRLSVHFVGTAGGTVELISPDAPHVLTPGDHLTIGIYPVSSTSTTIGSWAALAQVDP